MQIEVRGLSLSLTDALAAHAHARVTTALGRVSASVSRAVVRLSDVNGPAHGGVDKRCHIAVDLVGAGTLVLTDHDADLYTAIDRAAGRLAVAVRRTLARRQHTARRSAPPPPPRAAGAA